MGGIVTGVVLMLAGMALTSLPVRMTATQRTDDRVVLNARQGGVAVRLALAAVGLAALVAGIVLLLHAGRG
jgi:hypothetical protein